MKGGFPEYLKLIGEEHYDLVVCEMAHTSLEKLFIRVICID